MSQIYIEFWFLGRVSLNKRLVSSLFFPYQSRVLLHYKQSYFEIKAGVPQGSILAPLMYSVYTADIPLRPHTALSAFADDKAITTQIHLYKTLQRQTFLM